jgi:hypothetical protein
MSFGPGILLLAMLGSASGADREPPVVTGETALVAPVFSGPEVAKLDWNVRALVAHDIDGDGRVDLALINNDRAAVELLFQRDLSAPTEQARTAAVRPSNRWVPVLEDARFRRETLIVGQSLFDLAIADFNGDGRADIACTGEPSPLVVRLAQEDGSWEEKTFSMAPAPMKFLGCLATADLDGDKFADLVVLGQREIAVFLQKPGLGLVLDEKISLADDDAYGLLLHDIDGDARPDLLHLVSGHRETLRVRYQVRPGKFGPELGFGLKTPRSPLIALAGGADARGKRPATIRGAKGRRDAALARAGGVSEPDVSGPLFASVVPDK